MAIDKLQDILVFKNYVSADDMAKAVAFATKHRSDPVDYLIAQELINKNTLSQAIGEYYGMPYVNLHDNKPVKETVIKVPKEIATKYRIIMFSDDSGGKYATDKPGGKELLSELTVALGKNKISLYYADSAEIDSALSLYKQPLETRFSKIIEEQKHIAPEILEEIIGDALLFRASDIHFEPQQDIVIVRFRVDGVLQEAGRFKKDNYENILNRIKVMS